MRPIKVEGTPPQEWIDRAAKITKLLEEAESITLKSSEYNLRLIPLLKKSDKPAKGDLIVGIVDELFQIRILSADGKLSLTILEKKKETDDSPMIALKELLEDNLTAAKLKKAEVKMLFSLVTALAQRAGTEAIIERHAGLWTEDAVRDWLLKRFHNKCWYSEAKESVSSFHVDHYRPKSRTKDDNSGITARGYWWLAFQWSNYRICGQLLNVKKVDEFPFGDGTRGNHRDIESIKFESPILIDPRTKDARFISFEFEDEDSCVAVASGGIAPDDTQRATRTIEILGLNRLTKLNSKRAEFWTRTKMAIIDYTSAQSQKQALRQVAQASAQAKLKEMIAYEAEFSSVAEACVRKNAPEPLLASVFGND